MQVNAGQIICKEGDPSESIYMVLHGRLRTIHEKKEGDIEILGEFGHGDSVGELEVLSKYILIKCDHKHDADTSFLLSWRNDPIYSPCYP
jgi:CRP-like cAMP-binding protein